MTDKQTQGQSQNTDRELWRTAKNDYYSKHEIFVTKDGAIGFCQNGHCITMPPEKWFALAQPDAALAQKVAILDAIQIAVVTCGSDNYGAEEAISDIRYIIENPSSLDGLRAAALPSTPPCDRVEDETAWLVEKGGNGPPQYITTDEFSLTWTTDVNKALRLARRADAEAISELCDDAWHVVEHMWSNVSALKPAGQMGGKDE